MVASESGTTQITSQSTEELFKRYNALNVDDKLALLYYVYEDMGDSVTPAAPGAADPSLAQPLAEELFALSKEDQLQAMRNIVEGKDTPLSKRYGGLNPNNQLLVWYIWAEAMGDRVIDLPNDYSASAAVKTMLNLLEGVDFQEQITLLREAATQMGYSEIGAPPSQSETGKTDSL